ncbi:MAG TPA: DUF3375 domain-containing protein [Ktedonobacteraceae bacterium]|nr:DUF3375 domain-containing protein [Ktedonobacteraceae bacterium]
MLAQTVMDYDQLTYDLQHAPGIRLLKAEHAALIISFLYRQFKREQHVAIPFAELTERLADMLEALNEQVPDSFPQSAPSYLTEWADEQHRYLRITTPTSSDTPLVELTAETERAIGWVEELHGQPFVGTESRFLHIVQLLRDIVQKSTQDPAERLAQLEQQRDALQQQINQIRATGIVDDLYTTTQLKERFFEACDGARQLLRDFRLVEDRFRDIARALQQAQLESNVLKGDLVAFVLDADTELKSSDQGRSFYTFWDFLMAPLQQDELYGLLNAIQHQTDLQPVIHQGRILQHLPSNLLAAGEKVVQSNAGLAQQLRRLLDERSIAERHRVRAIVSEIKKMAFRVASTSVDEVAFIELEGPPEARLVMEYALWEPGETFSLSALPVNADDAEPPFDDLVTLHTQFHVDKLVMYRNIEELLQVYSQVTLADVLVHYPPEKGLTEVMAYCTLAADDPDHSIDEQQTETIEISIATPSGQEMRTLNIPHVLYRRRTYAD